MNLETLIFVCGLFAGVFATILFSLLFSWNGPETESSVCLSALRCTCPNCRGMPPYRGGS